MKNKVLRAIEDYGMLRGVTEVTVALSGGADSVALLHCLYSMREQLGIRVFAVHLNHNLRGEESDRDELFVRKFCEELGVELTVQSTDIVAVCKDTRESTELAARRVRYEFFEKEKHGVVATAHTASDSVETVIFNMTRGTAIKGLCGIPPVREGYIRPLIYCTRQEIEDYCSSNNLEFVNDSTNFTDEYTRNKIRHNVVPVLKNINTSLENAVMRMSDTLREDNSFLEEETEKQFLASVSTKGADVLKLKDMHPAIAKRVLKRFFENSFSASLDSVNLELLYKTAIGNIGATVLPSGVSAVIKNGFLCFSDGENIPDFNFKVEIKQENIKKINSLLLNSCIDCGKIVGELNVRTRLSGDKIRLNKRGITKSLKKLFNEMKIPAEERELIPVISDRKGVVWVYGAGVDERVKVDKNTENIFIIDTQKILN